MKRGKFALLITLFVMVFFYLPVVIVAINSFNSARFGGEWKSFTLIWYSKLFADKNIWSAFMNSLLIAFSSAVLSMILGSVAAFALEKYKSRFQTIHRMLLFSPLVVPDILIGMSLLIFFVAVKIQLGLMTVFLAHVTFSISYVAMVVLARLQDFDSSLYEAALDLGAGRFNAMRLVVIPLVFPGILAGGIMAFTLSIDDFVITFFVSGAGAATLPGYIYSMMKHGFPAVINSLSVLFVIATFFLVLMSRKFLVKQ